MARGEKGPLPVYECRPPEWLPKAHNSADLGYVGFFPPRPDQEEEILTEANVKNGIAQGYSVPIETYSAQETVNSRLVGEDTLTELEELMNQIFTRRSTNVPPVPTSSFKLPSRVTLNDSKRQQWFHDLSDPSVPLHKLGKSVPHGAKGHDLLDLLHTHNVEIPRAVWFLRVFGANETAGLRNKPQYNPTQYSVEWANVVTSYLRKQLSEISLPMAPRPGLNIKVTFKGVLAEQESRERWLSRFKYSLKLLRSFYSEGLVDNRTFLAWLVQQVATCNLAQLSFIARLVDEYLDGMLVCRALTHPLVEACLTRLSEIYTTLAKEYLVTLASLLKALISRTLLAAPDAFVSPKMWIQHADLLQNILSDFFASGNKDIYSEQTTKALRQTFLSHFDDVKKRNEAMLFRDLPPRVRGSLSSALADIKLLNSFCGSSDIEAISFFDELSEDVAAFTKKLDILLTWSVTPLQFGDHRPYAAATLLRFWRDRAEERAVRRDRESPDDLIQDQLFDWLDSNEICTGAGGFASIALLYGQLVRRELFSYPKYIQRLIARGERGLSTSEEPGSRHREFLKWIPLHSSSSSLIAQRKVTLYGLRVRETPEDLAERDIRKEIRALLPELFGGEPLPMEMVTNGLCSHTSKLLSATRYTHIRVLNDWLIPIVKKAVTSIGPDSDTSVLSSALRAYCVVTELMAYCKCYESILDLTLFSLVHTLSSDLLTAVMQTLRQHTEVWAGLNVMKEIVTSLYSAHCVWKNRGVQSRALFILIIELDGNRHLDPAARDQVISDYTVFTHALHPASDQSCVVPPALPEILLLATDPSPDAPSMLANTLWYKYRSAPDWAWKVWDNTIASLRQIPSMINDLPGRRICALRYASFLTHVDQHIPAGSDSHILAWFLGSGRNEVEALSSEAWDVVTVVLLHLSIYGALATTTILQGLVYPTWQAAAFASSSQQGSSLEVLLGAVIDLCAHLLLKDICGDGYPPVDFFEVHGLHTRRRDVYRDPYFSHLVQNIPALVLVEQNLNLSDQLRLASRAFRESLCSTSVFRLGVYRDLDTVHTAFEQMLTNSDVPDDFHEPLVNALRLMFNEGQQGYLEPTLGWQMLSTLLSPWKLAATSIELRFTMKQLGEALRRDTTRDRANEYLDKITSKVFGQVMDSEEADFMAEMMKDACAEITHKFVNAGMYRISEVLNDTLHSRNLRLLVSTAGDILRLLTNVVDPLRKDGLLSHQLDPWVQDKLVHALHDELSAVLELTSQDQTDSDRSHSTQAVIFLARLLQFNLGFSGAWTEEMAGLGVSLCGLIFKLALAFGSGSYLDSVAFPVLTDTLYFFLDEIPTDPKASAPDPFYFYPQIELQNLPHDMPVEYRQEIRFLLPFVSPNTAVAELGYVSKDNSGAENLVPVQNRPWEWTEYLGDPVAPDRKDDRGAEETSCIKNSASISLELFSARPTGERIVVSGTSDVDLRVDGDVRALQDEQLGESVFKRDWRETRVDPERALSGPVKSQDDANSGIPNAPNNTSSSEGRHSSSQSSRMASPASSVRSRGSVQPFGGPFNPSPASASFSRFTGSNAGDPIDVDSLDMPVSAITGQSKGKRKMPDIAEDDEVEILEGASSSQAAKKPKGKTVAKPRAKKR